MNTLSPSGAPGERNTQRAPAIDLTAFPARQQLTFQLCGVRRAEPVGTEGGLEPIARPGLFGQHRAAEMPWARRSGADE